MGLCQYRKAWWMGWVSEHMVEYLLGYRKLFFHELFCLNRAQDLHENLHYIGDAAFPESNELKK